MNLNDLRTPMPLRDADFAAVRARVLSEIGNRRTRGSWFVFRFAAAMAMLIVALNVHEMKPTTSIAPVAPPQQVVSISQPPTPIPEPRIPNPEPRRHKPHRIKRAAPVATAASRIEIHTADPDIRIIWIVPKENS